MPGGSPNSSPRPKGCDRQSDKQGGKQPAGAGFARTKSNCEHRSKGLQSKDFHFRHELLSRDPAEPFASADETLHDLRGRFSVFGERFDNDSGNTRMGPRRRHNHQRNVASTAQAAGRTAVEPGGKQRWITKSPAVVA